MKKFDLLKIVLGATVALIFISIIVNALAPDFILEAQDDFKEHSHWYINLSDSLKENYLMGIGLYAYIVSSIVFFIFVILELRLGKDDSVTFSASYGFSSLLLLFLIYLNIQGFINFTEKFL